MKIFYLLLFSFIIFSCSAQRCATPDMQPQLFAARSPVQNIAARDTMANEIITVPVVIHVLYNNSTENISDAQVLSQIETLNNDYRRLNNIQNIPAAFAPLSADVKINFCIAKTDAKGKPTNGIIHKPTQITSWSADDQMKFSASGGDDTWDPKKYLNIWVCNLSGRSLGYSSLPGSQADKDGIVIQCNAFGTTGSVKAPFDKGRTATHEIGHWLGLQHIWGDALCGDDHIDDTPPQRSYNNGCPSFPHTSTCSINASGDMFMNFMDFTDDACMSMFTYGQKAKMRSQFALGNVRNSFLNSSACNRALPEEGPVAPDTIAILRGISLYPNPAVNFITIEDKTNSLTGAKSVVIYSMTGNAVLKQLLTAGKNTIQIKNLTAGIYAVKIGEGKEVKIMRLIVQ